MSSRLGGGGATKLAEDLVNLIGQQDADVVEEQLLAADDNRQPASESTDCKLRLSSNSTVDSLLCQLVHSRSVSGITRR